MLSVILDFEENKPEVFFGMDDAEVQLHDDGNMSIVFEDYHTKRVIEVAIGPVLLEHLLQIKADGEVGCHYIEMPAGQSPLK